MYNKMKKEAKPVQRFTPDVDAAVEFHKEYKKLVEKFAKKGIVVNITMQPMFDVYKDNEFKE